MNQISFIPVGKVINGFDESTDPRIIKRTTSKIIIYPDYHEALLNIRDCGYLDIVFYFHRQENAPVSLSGTTCSGVERGVFASRSPKRPNLIGITMVKLLEVNGNELIVEGLDALNNSPVIDIKCCDTSLMVSETDRHKVHHSILRSEPRIEIQNHIMNHRTDLLLMEAGQMHGHFCPGLAMGVMAAVYAMRQMQATSDGMEDLLAITETNNCFSDGIQWVTGCSFGNNALIYKDLGKTAFTLSRRDGKGIRICSKHTSGEVIMNAFPEFREYYRKVVKEQDHDPEMVATYRKLALERAFGTLEIPFEELFAVQEVRTEIPEYAAIRASVLCTACGESVMKNRTVEKAGQFYCYTCAGKDHMMLDGNGIHPVSG
ncbi:MAG: TrmO family methyltransferase [Bacteroidales bacterium]|jgi:formylmethanofuran dehydrogenase subunit E|nr:TrmO family methyltransferase [Bacteroidales bacterium]